MGPDRYFNGKSWVKVMRSSWIDFSQNGWRNLRRERNIWMLLASIPLTGTGWTPFSSPRSLFTSLSIQRERRWHLLQAANHKVHGELLLPSHWPCAVHLLFHPVAAADGFTPCWGYGRLCVWHLCLLAPRGILKCCLLWQFAIKISKGDLKGMILPAVLLNEWIDVLPITSLMSNHVDYI